MNAEEKPSRVASTPTNSLGDREILNVGTEIHVSFHNLRKGDALSRVSLRIFDNFHCALQILVLWEGVRWLAKQIQGSWTRIGVRR